MKTSYYIACYTKCKCTPEEYAEEAEKLKELFTQLPILRATGWDYRVFQLSVWAPS